MQDYTKDVTNCWPIRIVIISVQILCGHNYVCFTVIRIRYSKMHHFLMSISEDDGELGSE